MYFFFAAQDLRAWRRVPASRTGPAASENTGDMLGASGECVCASGAADVAATDPGGRAR